MRSERARVGPLVAGATVLLGIVLGLRPVSTERILAGYVLLLAAIGLTSFIRVLGATAGNAPVSQFEYALSRQPEQATRPPELVRIERELTLGATSAGHLHQRLLPLLRDAAIARLGYGFTRERLGDDTWELLRPDRPEPEDRTAPGLPLRRVRAIVAQLELL
jgi:hypothetical protein